MRSRSSRGSTEKRPRGVGGGSFAFFLEGMGNEIED